MNGRRVVLQVKTVLVISLIWFFDFGPLPIMSSLMLYVTIRRPLWFKTLVDRIYGRRY